MDTMPRRSFSAPTAIAVLLVVTACLLALGSWAFTEKEYVLEQ